MRAEEAGGGDGEEVRLPAAARAHEKPAQQLRRRTLPLGCEDRGSGGVRSAAAIRLFAITAPFARKKPLTLNGVQHRS